MPEPQNDLTPQTLIVPSSPGYKTSEGWLSGLVVACAPLLAMLLGASLTWQHVAVFAVAGFVVAAFGLGRVLLKLRGIAVALALLVPSIAFAEGVKRPDVPSSGLGWGTVLAAVGAAIVLAIFVYRLRRGPLDADGLTPAERAHWSRSIVGSFGRPRVGPVAFVALLLLAAAPGCATFAQQPVALQKAEVAALKCGLDGVQSTMKQLSPSVLDALAGDSPDWRAQLDQLKGIGINALMCTVAHSLYDALGGDVAQFASLRDLERAVELQLAVAGDQVAPLPTPTRRVLARGLQYLRDGLPPPRPPGK